VITHTKPAAPREHTKKPAGPTDRVVGLTR
jgi:hypothetical protein